MVRMLVTVDELQENLLCKECVIQSSCFKWKKKKAAMMGNTGSIQPSTI